MSESVLSQVEAIASGDAAARQRAYETLLKATESPVPWAYDVWDRFVTALGHENSHVRSIAAQLLANLALSDPKRRIARAFPALLAATRDPRFVTARHTLLSLWRIGLAGKPQRRMVVDGLASRFRDCVGEKNATLIRYDIAQSLRKLHDATGDEAVRTTALGLIALEDDPKYRKKYEGEWRGLASAGGTKAPKSRAGAAAAPASRPATPEALAEPTTIDDYIALFPPEVRALLAQLRATIRAAVPEATEAMKYRMPTFTLKGNLIHFAAFKGHIGVFPTPRGIEAFAEETAPYVASKGTLHFPYGRPIPYDLIARIAARRAEQDGAAKASGPRARAKKTT